MCLGALATQTGGSITRPASYCGVYSIKPTYGRVSVDGVMPLAPSMDHVGAIANSVRDLALLLQPLARMDTDEVPKPYHFLHEIDRRGGYERHKELVALPDFHPGRADQVMARAFDRLRGTTPSAGWTWGELPLPPSFGEVLRHHHNVMAVEAAAYHGERLRRHPDDYLPMIRGLIERGQSLPAPDYSITMQHMELFRVEIESTLLEAWRYFCTPATADQAPTADTTGDPAFNSPWSYSGLPTVSLPFKWTQDGLPLAVQLIGRPWYEADLLAVAAMLEADIGFERRPLQL
jgi:aspartyl-tRNA(Asn)/glutamyl-tRNA(Gln) amidotransferase subunit A